MYALVEIGKKQFKVAKGDLIKVPYAREAAEGSNLEIQDVLLLNDENNVVVGTPFVEKAKVAATVKEHGRERKILVFKKKRRKGYKKTIGHRQYFTVLEINDIITE